VQVMNDLAWGVVSDPHGLMHTCRGRVDPMRFRWLAVEWGERIRPLFEPADMPWFNDFIAWLAGDADHPGGVEAPTIAAEVFPAPVRDLSPAREFVEGISRCEDPLHAAVVAAACLADFARRKRSNNTKFRTVEQLLRHAAQKKLRRDRVHGEFGEQFRCVAGNPFRPVAFAPSWRSDTAVSLATGIYADRAFDRLPILADALEEAGCDHPDILTHCRGPGPHVRGCWVVDLVLDKS
jgi:hypothetical protein